MISSYLSAGELADLVGCKPNQRSLMAKWLDKTYWPYALDRNGLPKVSRAYHDFMMSGGSVKSKHNDEPNYAAFNKLTPHQERCLKAKQARKQK